MKRLLAAGIAAVAFCSASAFAADMPVKAPVYVTDNWTGFYVGGTVGYGVGKDPSAPTFAGPGFGSPFDRVTVAPGGWVGGVEAGYNLQMDKLILGVEADWQWTGQKDSFCLDCAPLGRGIGQELPWFATVRGRIGYMVGPALFYTTGGVAFGAVRSTLSCCTNQGPANFTDNKTGWVLGGGVEAALGNNWTMKIEYLHLDLGSTSDTFVLPAFAPATMTATSNVRDNIFRAGLNYRFGGNSAAAAYKPAAMNAYNWSGPYLGATIGYGAARDPIAQSFAGVPNDQFTFAPSGWLGGVEAGYNWQTDKLLLGVEADWQWTAQKDSGLCRDCPLTVGFTNQVAEQKLPWFATARGRVGYAAGPVLFYTTAGAAFTKLDTSLSQAVLPITEFNSFSNSKTGWVVGGGIEAALGNNWTAKAEYLYLDFGSISVTASPPVVATLASKVRDHVFRLGLNYKFGGPLTSY
jgi:outer membrane immunogenic protein